MPLRKNHQGYKWELHRQTSAAPLAASADEATACMGAHAHSEPRYAFAFAAGSFKGALGHETKLGYRPIYKFSSLLA